MKLVHPIYPITNTTLSSLTHSQQVEKLVKTGVGLIQLREKTASSRDFYLDAQESLTIARDAGVKIIINDRVDIALALNADGVHLGQDDLSPADARKILGEDAIIGFSTHSVEQAKAATALPVDYIAFGPVFPTSTKENPDEVTDVDKLREVREATGELCLVAIGGIGTENIDQISKTGADAAAVISALFVPPGTIEENVARLEQSWSNKNV